MKTRLILILAIGFLAAVEPLGTAWTLGVNPTVSDSTGDAAGGSSSLAGCFNTGTCALNTAFGTLALPKNTTGQLNTATGNGALGSNTSGSNNTATGAGALGNNTAGNNTATGAGALASNTTAGGNTATGAGALQDNTTGSTNTANGYLALLDNTSGTDETACGALALQNNTIGLYNTADGFRALTANTTGGFNTAAGVNALWKNITGGQNTAIGVNAMSNNTSGSNNLSLGYLAGSNLTTGNNNIEVGNPGVAAESNTIRIGTKGAQIAAYIAGINNTQLTGSMVVVDSSGRLGVVMSSARYKRDIHDMGQTSAALMKLRPVTFRYRTDPAGLREYGLIAEEVARVYPELVTYGADGKVQSVNYLTLSAMLLNELQKQNRQLREQTVHNQLQASRIAVLTATVKADHDREAAQQAAFERRLAAIERELAASARAWQEAAASRP